MTGGNNLWCHINIRKNFLHCKLIHCYINFVFFHRPSSFQKLTSMCHTAISDLSLQKCVPCNRKDLSPMTEGSANVLKPKIPEWELLNDGGVMKLCRKWKVKNFLLGLEFFKIVADLAESEGHHPDLHLVGWNNVTIEIWTHACGGLTENDFILAAKIDKLPFESYLKRSK
ncbi:pterin-4-alpha-carbinolamine dehydratase 2, mitochondrial-like isoform X1 [Bidens hawaiensis]|uniref:pterin-4-alpha-carbinolamine dehydratase 2, mitochondrial-like isoform X1 n=1 Tax=Bidens hawaiensis TaxID=980011 RepID=UPI004049EDE2